MDVVDTLVVVVGDSVVAASLRQYPDDFGVEGLGRTVKWFVTVLPTVTVMNSVDSERVKAARNSISKYLGTIYELGV